MRRYFPLIFLLFTCSVFSQSNEIELSSTEIRTAYVSSINVVNEYSSILNKKTSSYSDLFSLFSDSTSKVPFDILPENKLNNSIELDRYILKAARSHRQQKVVINITDINIIGTNNNSDVNVLVTFEKIIDARTRDGINYKDIIYNLNMYLKLKKSNSYDTTTPFDAKIDSITLGSVLDYKFQIAYVVENDTTYDLANNNLIVNKRKPISYETDWIGEGNNYFFLRNNTKKSRNIKYSLDNAPFAFSLESIEREKYKNYRSFNSIKNVLLLKIKRPRFSLSILSNQSNVNLIDPNIFGLNNQKLNNTINELGFELGYYLNYKPKPLYYYTSLSLGVSRMNLQSTFSLVNFDYQFEDIDPSENNYLRKIKINSLSEQHDITYLNFPLSFKYGINLNELYLNRSLENYLFLLPDFISLKISGIYHNLQTSTYSSSANINYSGLYEDFFGIEITDNGVYDFGNFNLLNEDIVNYKDYFSGMIVLGLQNKLSKEKDRLFLDLEFGLNFNFTDPFIPEDKYISSDLNELNSSLNLIDKVSMNRNFLRLGFTYNF